MVGSNGAQPESYLYVVQLVVCIWSARMLTCSNSFICSRETPIRFSMSEYMEISQDRRSLVHSTNRTCFGAISSHVFLYDVKGQPLSVLIKSLEHEKGRNLNSWANSFTRLVCWLFLSRSAVFNFIFTGQFGIYSQPDAGTMKSFLSETKERLRHVQPTI